MISNENGSTNSSKRAAVEDFELDPKRARMDDKTLSAEDIPESPSTDNEIVVNQPRSARWEKYGWLRQHSIDYPWIQYNTITLEASCSFIGCNKATYQSYDRVLLIRRKWKYPKLEPRLFIQHQETQMHQNQCRKLGQQTQKKLNPSNLRDTLVDDGIMSRILSGWWLAKEDVSVRKFGSYLETQMIINGQEPPTSYRDDRVAWEIIEILGRYFRNMLKHRVQKSPYFGIMVDETTDNSTTAQLILYIKFLDEIDGTITPMVEYLDLISPASGVAEDLTVLSGFGFTDCRRRFTSRSNPLD